MAGQGKETLGRTLLLLTALIWGSSFFVMKHAVDAIPVLYVLAIRFSIGAVLAGLILFRRLRGRPWQQWLHGILCGAVQYGAYVAQNYGLTGTTPGKNAFLTAVYCVLVPFVCWLCWRERPTSRNWLAAVLCIVGIGLVSLTGDLRVNWGDGLTLLGGVLFALQVAMLGHYGHQGDDPLVLAEAQFLIMGALGWITSAVWAPGARVPAEVWPQMLYLSVAVTAIAMLMQAVGQSITPPPQAAILMSLESVFGILFSVLFYGERVGLRMLIGFIVIFISVLVSETKPGLWKRSRHGEKSDPGTEAGADHA